MADIESAVPASRVFREELSLRTLGNRLKMLVWSDKAIEALTEAIKMARAGLGHDHKLLVPSCSLARPAWGKPR
ncbi:MAG: hypothetical protein ACLTXH_03550 [Enterobacter hormaechei]